MLGACDHFCQCEDLWKSEVNRGVTDITNEHLRSLADSSLTARRLSLDGSAMGSLQRSGAA